MLSSRTVGFSLALLLTATLVARDADAAAPPSSTAFFKSITKSGTIHTGAALTNMVMGFNVFHATTCVAYNPSTTSGSHYLFVYPQEGGYLFTDSAYDQFLIGPTCAVNLVGGIDVTDTTTGAWDQYYSLSQAH